MLANERAAVTDAVRLADLWLDDVTAFPSGIRKIEAWSKSEWLEATFPVWSSLCEPIAAKAVDAMGSMMAFDPSQLDDAEVPPEMRAMLSGMGGLSALAPMLRQLGGAMLGGQVGTAIGELAGDMASSTDIGLPLGRGGHRGAAAVRRRRVRRGPVGRARARYGCSSRCARRRTTGCSGTCRGCASTCSARSRRTRRGISVDMSRLRDALPELDMTNPEEALREALSGETLFRPEDTPQQKAALARLETALALVEGWVAAVVSAAADARLVHAVALAEAIRRRRASGGPAERTFATLVGLELRPRMLREAAALWAGLAEARGTDGRDALWAHPDLLPTADDLENPDAFLRGNTDLDMSDFEDAVAGERPAEGTQPADGEEPRSGEERENPAG